MLTVADIIESWNAYFERENQSGHYSDDVRIRGAELIAENPEYWGNNSMRKLLLCSLEC